MTPIQCQRGAATAGRQLRSQHPSTEVAFWNHHNRGPLPSTRSLEVPRARAGAAGEHRHHQNNQHHRYPLSIPSSELQRKNRAWRAARHRWRTVLQTRPRTARPEGSTATGCTGRGPSPGRGTATPGRYSAAPSRRAARLRRKKETRTTAGLGGGEDGGGEDGAGSSCTPRRYPFSRAQSACSVTIKYISVLEITPF